MNCLFFFKFDRLDGIQKDSYVFTIKTDKFQSSVLSSVDRIKQKSPISQHNLLLCGAQKCSSGASYIPCDLYRCVITSLYETKFRQEHGNCPKI